MVAVTKAQGGDWANDEQILGEEGHPGKLMEKLASKYNLTLSQVADGAQLSRPLVSAIKNEKRRITPDTALKLGAYFGVDPALWTAAQARYDFQLGVTKLHDLADIRSHKEQ